LYVSTGTKVPVSLPKERDVEKKNMVNTSGFLDFNVPS